MMIFRTLALTTYLTSDNYDDFIFFAFSICGWYRQPLEVSDIEKIHPVSARYGQVGGVRAPSVKPEARGPDPALWVILRGPRKQILCVNLLKSVLKCLT